MKNWLFRASVYLGIFPFLAFLSPLYAGFQDEARVQLLTEGLQ